MKRRSGRFLVVLMTLLAIMVFYSTNNRAVADKKDTTSGSGWSSWNHDDDSNSGDKGHGGSDDRSSGHKPKKKKPSKSWLTNGNKNIDPDKHFLGTTDEADLVIKTDNGERLRITASGDVGIGVTEPHGEFEVGDRTDPDSV